MRRIHFTAQKELKVLCNGDISRNCIFWTNLSPACVGFANIFAKANNGFLETNSEPGIQKWVLIK